MAFSRLSRVKKVDWNYNTEGFEFKKCADMPLDTIFIVRGAFITPDRGFGRGAVLILDDCNLNLSARYLEDVEAILDDTELQEDIKTGKAGIKITTFISDKYKKTGYNVEFLDIK